MSDRLAQLVKLHEMDPADPFCTYGIALEHVKAGDIDAALPWFDRTLEADPDYLYAYFHKAKALIDDGREDEARPILEVGLERARAAGDDKASGELEELLSTV